MNVPDKKQYIKVRKEGGTTVISVGKLIPKDWKLVELVQRVQCTDKMVTVNIVKVA